MSTKEVTSIINLDYDILIKTIDNYKDDLFVYQAGNLYLVNSIEWDIVRTNSWAISDISYLVWVYTTTQLLDKPNLIDDDWNPVEYIIMQYKNQWRVKAIYKDILWEWSYYWGFKTWLKKSIWMVNDFMFNIIDEKVWEAIDAINIDSTEVLSIIDTYHMPVSRDLMLAKAIEKYSLEMQTMLTSIANKELKSWFESVVNAMKDLINPKPKVKKVPVVPVIPKPKKTTTRTRKTGTTK